MPTQMKPRVLAAAAALLLLAALSPATTATADTEPAPPAPLRRAADPVPGQYIVTVRDGAAPAAVLRDAVPEVEPLFTYTAALNGFAARLSAEQLAAVRAQPDVEAVEEDGMASGDEPAADPLAAAASWGLDRIDQPYLPLNQEFNVEGTGAGTTVYVIDSGIDFGHADFQGRAVRGYDSVGDGRDGADCAGHGTHVAGTVGGATYGVARETTLVSVRVLGCDNRGEWSQIIAGFDWVAQHAQQPAVANASLGGDLTQSVNEAADRLADRGVLPVISAGNEGGDACDYSPASARGALTVGATDADDQETAFSNFGPCLDLYAPGQAIISAKLGGGSTAKNGTSMSAPHVSGVAALRKAADPDATPEQLTDWLIEQSTKDVLDVTKTSPDRLLSTGGL
ncbi:S8 family peptidase [Streptomyces sp. MP131-18]|uniref:S8 family peptidase n=1 Tax=Streptomyces sp. MP131-18 TaxID=1857892 RepID=UPI0009D191CF|nr:S8 family peptidase [Streptomyces sp. MP131-18]ONK15978.1 Extracellular serine proteinase precursor [Streptomyces sp. MP131-18]